MSRQPAAITSSVMALSTGTMLPLGQMEQAGRMAPVWLDDIAVPLSRQPRFQGQSAPGTQPLSVARHCLIGARLFEQAGQVERARAFLLHDAHEALIGDITTPVANALAAVADAEFPDKAGHAASHFVKVAIAGLKHRCDVWLHAHAGVPFPLASHVAEDVKRMDRALLKFEAMRGGLVNRHPAWSLLEGVEPPRVPAGWLKSAGPQGDAIDWLDAFDRLCPAETRRQRAA